MHEKMNEKSGNGQTPRRIDRSYMVELPHVTMNILNITQFLDNSLPGTHFTKTRMDDVSASLFVCSGADK